MSLQELHELRQQLEKEQGLRKEEQQRREGAELQLKLQTQNTTLAEFLDACHTHLFLGLTVQKDKDSSTKGDPANADRKLRPDYIREWKDFPEEQFAIWQDLMDADFVAERNFAPLLVLKEYGKELRERSLGSELDLGYFERQTVESRVASVIKQLHANPRLRQTFCLKGDIAFENHANTLTDESKLEADMSYMSLHRQPRRSRRLAAISGQDEPSSSSLAPAENRKALQKHPRPRADQFCVYNKDSEGNVPAFIIEYKAPHKLSLAHIRAGLQDMDLDQIVRLQEDETPEDTCRRVVGAVITQATSYMNNAGLKFGYITTGEAFIFLRVRRSDPRTAYYFLSVPKEDVGQTTGWTGNVNGQNRLHLTALGQVLAFTLRALRKHPRDIGWIQWAGSQLNTWEMVYDDILDEIAEEDVPSSDFKPAARSRDAYCRMSPVKTRSKSGLSVGSCNLTDDGPSSDNDSDSCDGFGPNTPSRPPRERNIASRSATHATANASKNPGYSGTNRQYCTQLCLRGLLMGYGLDKSCPNASDHGADRHQLKITTLIHRLRQQLSCNDLHAHSQLGCTSLHIHGTRGAVFKLTLHSHGYTFLGKGVPAEFIQHAKREESIYSRLTSIQGVVVPVVMGGLDVPCPFYYDGIALMVHLTLMSYTGKSLSTLHEVDRKRMVQHAESSLRAVHKLAILHGDPIAGNMTWNEENRRVMLIDFGRATFPIHEHGHGQPLVPISANRKRKRVTSTVDKGERERPNRFECEARRMRNRL